MSQSQSTFRPKRLDRQLLLAVLLAAAVVIPRGIVIIQAQSPCFDDNYHIYHGLLFLRGQMKALRDSSLNDPPLGQALSAIPAWLNGIQMPKPPEVTDFVPGKPPPAAMCFSMPQNVRIETAIWKSILFLPFVAVVFCWVTSIYSSNSAWLAVALFLAEPTLAAHLPLPTLDVLGMEAIVIASWTLWRFVLDPSRGRRMTAVIAVAAALLIKHTALPLLVAVILLAAADWLVRRRLWREPKVLGLYASRLFNAGVLLILAIFVLMRFDVSQPAAIDKVHLFPGQDFAESHVLPAGTYVSSVIQGMYHAREGHTAYLLGQINMQGWWYYFPVVATYKIPLGIAVVVLLAMASLAWIRPRYQETPLLICGGLWTAAVLFQHIDIGFRHFLPAEAFLLMLAARVLATPRAATLAVAWLAVAIALVDITMWTPNDLGYVNFPRRAAYLDISDSNIDWGQALNQTSRWVDAQPADGRPIYVVYFGPLDLNLYDHFSSRLTEYGDVHGWIPRPGDEANPDNVKGPFPDHGILIISPLFLSGQYSRNTKRFAIFRTLPPDQTIGDCMLVYDLDRLRAMGKLPPPSPAAQTRQAP